MTQVYHALGQQGGHAASHFPDWGNIPAYFGGLALLIAIYTLSRDHRERRRSQADKVVAWAERAGDGYKVFVRNKSELPVTEVIIALNVGYRRSDAVRLDKFTRPDRWHKPQYVDVLPPDHTEEVRFFKPGPAQVSGLSFIDSSGSKWSRTSTQLQLRKSNRIFDWASERRRQFKLRRTEGYRPDQD
jgi:hypothetical protein